MGRYCKRYLAVSREEYDRVHDILTKFFDRGDIDYITVEFRGHGDPILIGLENSTDDYSAIAKELGIKKL